MVDTMNGKVKLKVKPEPRTGRKVEGKRFSRLQGRRKVR